MTRARSASIAGAIAASWALIAGAAMVIEPWYAFRRFDSLDLIPSVIALQVSRAWGAWGAALVTCLLVTGVLHARATATEEEPQASTPESGREPVFRTRVRTVAVAALAVPLLYAPVSALAFSGAMLAGWRLGLPPHAFLERIELADVQCGLMDAVALGLIPAGWLLFGRRVWGSRRGLGFKLFATYAVLFGGAAVLRLLVSLIES